MINTKWLLTFSTLCEEKSFTRTANKLFMTQSGVSQHLAKLEDHLAQTLVIREGKQFVLTDAGLRLLDDANAVLAAINNLEQHIGFDTPDEGKLRIMTPGSVGLKLYPHCLDLQQTHPALNVEFRFAPNRDIDKALLENTIDIGLMTRTSLHSEIVTTPLAEEPLLLVTPAAVEDCSWQTLETLGFIAHPDSAHHAELLLGANYPQYRSAASLPQTGFSNQIGLILEPVSRGLGATVLPAHAVAAFPNQHAIRIHQLDVPVSETIYLAEHHLKPRPARVDMLVTHIKRWLKH